MTTYYHVKSNKKNFVQVNRLLPKFWSTHLVQWYETYPGRHQRISAKIAHLCLVVGTTFQVRRVPHGGTDLTCDAGPCISGGSSQWNVLMYIMKKNVTTARLKETKICNVETLGTGFLYLDKWKLFALTS